MDDDALTNWALANRASLTLDLLSWIARAQLEAAAAEKERLWALGSKLMAVREGLGTGVAPQGQGMRSGGSGVCDASFSTASLASSGCFHAACLHVVCGFMQLLHMGWQKGLASWLAGHCQPNAW